MDYHSLMRKNGEPPALADRYLCIVDRDSAALAAVISSYLFQKNSYLPLFLFPPVTAPKTSGDNLRSEIYLSNAMGSDASVLINNAWARMGGSQYLILAGLSGVQKSYLSIPIGTKIIEIGGLDDVAAQFSTIASQGHAELRCKASDILIGLSVAQREGKRLVIDERAPAIPRPAREKGGHHRR